MNTKDRGILVVGSVALDSVKTPFGGIKNALGGSATYFSTAASYFSDVKLVAVVGKDFSQKHMDFLRKRKIDISGLQIKNGKTFRWKGYYEYDLNNAHTLETHLNVFADFKPDMPENYRNSKYVFLGNIDPDLQLIVLKQVKSPKIIGCDTMNYWIEGKYNSLKKTIKHVDILIINEAEAREFAKEKNLVAASRKIMSWGPPYLVVKRGEYGALLFAGAHIFFAPAYPLEEVIDPTGAGDSFAGGFMGYLASHTEKLDIEHLKRAVVFGSVMASFNVESFSTEKLGNLTKSQIIKRFMEFKKLTHFEMLK